MVKLHLLPLIPFLGFLVSGLWSLAAARSRREAKKLPIAMISTLAVFASFVLAFSFYRDLLQLPVDQRMFVQEIYQWISVGDFQVSLAFRLDPLSSLMVLVITGVGGLIHLYSIGYMFKDPGLGRYFSILNLFLSAMLVLVLAGNLPLMFVGWEGVGLCSYLLIGFWFDDEAKARAGKKAFIVNRVGDFAFLLGIFLCFTTLGSVEFTQMAKAVESFHPGSAVIPHAIGWICFLLFLGACGKSAQFPLHVWLPDAMAGPTPVSALIHAATMVTAGVYMIARLSFLYALVPDIGFLVAAVGSLTAFMAALIAMTQNDIKKVLAYSTISQLGYMFLAVGLGAYTAGVFHLMTHAFFKGLLFLGAGSVIHALSEEQDIRKMGGLFRRIPYTFWTFAIATVAIVGLPPFAGFFSKDEILWETLQEGHVWLYVLGLITALLTAFYMTRLFVLTFLGQTRTDQKTWEHIHESPMVMVIPLVILAFFSAVSGFLGLPHFLGFLGGNILEKFLAPVFSQAHLIQEGFLHLQKGSLSASHPPIGEGLASLVAIVIASGGAYFAYWIYLKAPGWQKELNRLKPLHNFVSHKFYIDEVYEKLILRPIHMFSEEVLWKQIDARGIDALVLHIARFFPNASEQIKKIQSGHVRVYVLSAALGIVFLLGFVILL